MARTGKEPGSPAGPRRRRLSWPGHLRPLIAAALIGLLGLSGAPAASAHEGGSGAEGYILVQQAIGYLLNMPEPEASMHAQERVTAALAAADQEGVSVDQLKQAQSALQAGKPDEARTLLQESITDAVKALQPAKGVDTGTGAVLPPFTPPQISGPGWVFLTVSILAIAGGIWLAVVFRPREGVRKLREEMGSAGRGPGNTAGGTEEETR